MSQEIIVSQEKNLSLWDSPTDLRAIKEIYGSKLSLPEFNTFIQMGRATGLNPFLREIWAIKYGDSPASIFVGRDGYRRSAQGNPNYDYHHVEAVYKNDELHYDLSKGEVTHKHDIKDMGELIGAYCIVVKKNASKPIYVFVPLKEYTTGKSQWAAKPATMIKKVAESQALRMAFQELFGGTYGEEEIEINPIENNKAHDITVIKSKFVEDLKREPIIQQLDMSPETLQKHIDAINGAKDRDELKKIYNEAKAEAKHDKSSSNIISVHTKIKKEELLKSVMVSPEVEIVAESEKIDEQPKDETAYNNWMEGK